MRTMSPRLELGGRFAMSVVVQGVLNLGLRERCLCFVESFLHLSPESSRSFIRDIHKRFKAHPGVPTSIRHEGSHLHQSMDMVCEGELGCREEIVPVVLVVIAEHPDVRLEFLVDVFSLSVGLCVVGRRGCSFDPEKSVEFPHELRDEN